MITIDCKELAREQGTICYRGGQLEIEFISSDVFVSGKYYTRGGVTIISDNVELEETEAEWDFKNGNVNILAKYQGETKTEATYPNNKSSEFLITAWGTLEITIDLKTKLAEVVSADVKSKITSPYNRLVQIEGDYGDELQVPEITFDEREVEFIDWS